MIILDRGPNDAERMLVPRLDSNNILRIATASANLAQDTVSWVRFSSKTSSASTRMYNSAGRFYFQPASNECLANSRHDEGIAVETLASVHYSPHKDYLPTLATDSSGNYFCSYGEYDNNLSLFCPYNYRGNSSKLPLKDIEIVGYAGSITHESGNGYSNVWTRINKNSTPDFPYTRWHAWCLGILTTSGTTDISEFVMMKNTTTDLHTNVTVDLMLNSGNSVYVLIKSDISEFSQFPSIGLGTIMDQPRLKIVLSNNSSFQVTSYGFDITPSPIAASN